MAISQTAMSKVVDKLCAVVDGVDDGSLPKADERVGLA
jgi:hypothetical protein